MLGIMKGLTLRSPRAFVTSRFSLNVTDAADATAKNGADACRILDSPSPVGIANGFLGSHQGILDKGIQPPRLFAVHVLTRVEAAHFTGKIDTQIARIETGDIVDA